MAMRCVDMVDESLGRPIEHLEIKRNFGKLQESANKGLAASETPG
jgi:hypothetical protein